MQRRTILASTGALLAGCLGRGEPGPGGATSTEEHTPIAPQVDFSFSLDRNRERATVTHASGEALTAERTDRLELVLTTAPDRPIPTDATLTPTRTPHVIRRTWREAGGHYPITEGDAVTFEDATPGDTLAVWWYGTEAHADGTRLESTTFAKV